MKFFLVVALIFSISCSTMRQSYTDKKNDIGNQFIEVGYFENNRRLLLENGTMFSQKKGFLGFWKLRSEKVDLDLTRALFDLANSKEFEVIPTDLDNVCGIKITKKVPPAKHIDFVSAHQPPSTITSFAYFTTNKHQPFDRIYIKNPNSKKEIIWRECRAFSEYMLTSIKNEIESDSTITTLYEEVVSQNEKIKNNLALLNNFLNKFYSLNE